MNTAPSKPGTPTTAPATPRTAPATTPAAGGTAAPDPRLGWNGTPGAPAPPSAPPTIGTPGAPHAPAHAPHANSIPVLLHRRDGILPAVAAALSVRGETLTCTGSKGDRPPTQHPLVQDFLDALPAQERERHTGRCAETMLLSRFLTATEAARAGKRVARRATAKHRPLTHNEAKRALKHAKLTARHIREDGDPLHGRYAPPCRSCTALLAHFGVRPVDPGPPPHAATDVSNATEAARAAEPAADTEGTEETENVGRADHFTRSTDDGSRPAPGPEAPR